MDKKEKNFWKTYFGITSTSLVPENLSRLPCGKNKISQMKILHFYV